MKLRKIAVQALMILRLFCIRMERRLSGKSNKHMAFIKVSRGISWEQSCTLLANKYQLSPREREVLYWVSCGRDAVRIGEILTIASHTAKTHMNNIYRKLDIHSQQEVIDLVEYNNDKFWVEEQKTVA